MFKVGGDLLRLEVTDICRKASMFAMHVDRSACWGDVCMGGTMGSRNAPQRHIYCLSSLHAHARTHMHAHACTCTHMHAHARTHMHARTCTHVHACTCTYFLQALHSV